MIKYYSRRIYVDGMHWDGLLALPCVRGIVKRTDQIIVAKVKLAPGTYRFACVGDALVEDENGNWQIEPKE